MLTEVDGDLLADDAAALVNPVNCQGVMGKGLAAAFKKRWPAMFASYRSFCQAGRMHPGVMHLHQLPDGRWIINFPTKVHWRDRSRLEWIEDGLLSLVGAVGATHATSVAIPALGCGEGGLDWAEVRPLIVACFDTPDLDVRLYRPVGL